MIDHIPIFGPVRDSKNSQCVAGYAFAATSLIEAFTDYSKNPTTLSPQNIIDCGPETASGCLGGNVVDALKYVQANGIAKEDDYKYSGASGTCDSKPERTKPFSTFTALTVQPLNFGQLNYWFDSFSKKPLAAYIDASSKEFALYVGKGALDPVLMLCVQKNHVVNLIGYSPVNDYPNQILGRNSFGENWGYNGDFFINENFLEVQTCYLQSSIITIDS